MSTIGFNRPQFSPGERVVSLVFHPPEIVSGTKATIVAPHEVVFYAVKLPNGELHRWVADFELEPVTPRQGYYFNIGDLATVKTDEGHHGIKKGMTVKIAKVFTNVPLYDVILENGEYHRWLAEFEITYPI